MAPALSDTGSDSAPSGARGAARATTINPRPRHTAQPYVLEGANVVLPTGTVKNGRLTIDGTKISDNPPENAHTLLVHNHWLVPGFVDLHNHGGGGASFTSGTVEEVLQGIRTHQLHGTTTLVASTVTGDMDGLAHRAGLLSELAEQGDIAGIHFEGPFISPCRKGAHAEALLRDPDPAEVRKLIDAARGRASMVTLATELPGGLDSVRLLAELGVLAAIGHTDATYEQTVQAIDAGATVATHLFNAMPPLGHREPGPIAALLEDERITVELINDGTHLHPASLQLAFRHAGAARVAFITDAMDAAGFGDGRYMLGPLEVEVADGVARLVEGGSIAGSTLTQDRALKRAVTVDRLPIEDAVAALSANPARLLGLDDRIGSLDPGKDADLVLLDADFDVKGVLRKGEWVVNPFGD
ncbi:MULTISPECIES: N-acetylglucosamine-6-phosphate deacetylase [Streptomyces]|uniref:N-acetylglucosamine-6-phosphate deacetylase n=1 Tax=Streptomyces stelliscabiei TaxID=146820 RepID=A0A8I0TUD1_9ACTN|nr:MULTISPECIES: N-acetylglucosamine-6-phosphate deacetylase [Streptomyces]KND41083.1 N-acetylglucosamine-6-phosphate deacetylase [Streptomyces stelliscabiei]MBE1598208.1 N-acetylglucosamine-6-phosphate deacetylase [Streptomyces stelliscabiei]MDX2520958.1 N-acetylglucosamine-6-phosphate deacetylase [Streptomyces stelliscabiei]MDX2555928.1 N-acetylglucosamine-6-phosphate deacetylase [Streptomyces stelliscabiei]MDX2616533.1 N-acetylglucosamine-6-phosphate deacetylase [Streptomyces stelliscabiei]